MVCCVEGANGTHFIVRFGRVVRTGFHSMVFGMVPSLVSLAQFTHDSKSSVSVSQLEEKLLQADNDQCAH